MTKTTSSHVESMLPSPIKVMAMKATIDIGIFPQFGLEYRFLITQLRLTVNHSKNQLLVINPLFTLDRLY